MDVADDRISDRASIDRVGESVIQREVFKFWKSDQEVFFTKDAVIWRWIIKWCSDSDVERTQVHTMSPQKTLDAGKITVSTSDMW